MFGGTFDPPHLGHVAAVTAALASLRLDELVVTVAGDPQGKDAPVAPAAVRLEMARAAFASIPGVVVSDLEVTRHGPTYTIDTIEALRAERPGDELVVVVGADAAASLPAWHRASELAELVTIAVVPREDRGAAVPRGFVGCVVAMAPVDCSSTQVRAAITGGADPASMVPPGVVPILLAHRLYSP